MEKKTAAAAGGDKQPPPPEKKSLMMMIPPDEERCCRNDGGRWRCTKSRMNLGVSKDDDGLDTKYYENHYNSFKDKNNKQQQPENNQQQQMKHKKKKKKKKSSSEDADDSSSSGTETWDSTFLDWKKVKYHRKGIRPPPTTNHTTSDIEGGSANVGTKRKTPEGKESSGKLEFTDFLIEKPSLITSNTMDKDKEMEKKMKLPLDEQRCCLKANGRWRCKNFRMSHGAADDNSVPKSRHCEKHYNYFAKYSKKFLKTKTSGNGEASLIPSNKMKLPPDEQRCRQSNGARWRCKNFRMSHGAADNDASDPKTKYCEKHYKNLNKRNGEGAAGPIRRNRKIVERLEGSEESEPVVEFESMENYKSKCYELSAELEKKKAECIKLQGELEEVKARKDATKDGTEWAPEDAPEYWRKMFFGLENRVLRIENENSTMRCVESRLSNLESLVLRNGKGYSKLKCVDLCNSEDMVSEARSFQNDFTQSGEKQRDINNMSKPNAETSREGNKDSHVHDIGTNKHHELESEFPKYSPVNILSGSGNLSSGTENVKEGKDRSCGEERPSQAHSEMSKKPFVNLVSENSGESLGEDSDSSDSDDSLADLMDMIAMKCKNDRDIKWKFEADMLSSFEEDPELCLKAVCALHRQQTSEDATGLFHYSDALRGTTLEKFLMDGACEGDLKKSVK